MPKKKEKRKPEIIITRAKNPNYKEVAKLILQQASKLPDEWFKEVRGR